MAAKVTRSCAHCGGPFETAPGSRARFCKPAHRVAAAKRRAAGLPEERAESLAEVVIAELLVPGSTDEPDEADELMSLEAVALELQRALRSRHTAPTAKASLAREYRATLEAIERSKPPTQDALGKLADELAAKRAARGA